jgi:hypothetical protein
MLDFLFGVLVMSTDAHYLFKDWHRLFKQIDLWEFRLMNANEVITCWKNQARCTSGVEGLIYLFSGSHMYTNRRPLIFREFCHKRKIV